MPTGIGFDPLSSAHHAGLISIAVVATLSFVATFLLATFITYRLLFSSSDGTRYIGRNQYIVLIYNLILADMQQSLAFLICIKWVQEGKIEAYSTACFLQGFWLQVGDPSSGIFVCAIALHTFLLVIMEQRLKHQVFVIGVIGLWLFIVLLVLVPIGLHGRHIFLPSGAWVSN
jgi:hypothetical protein